MTIQTFQRLWTTPGRTSGWLLAGPGHALHRTFGHAHDAFLADDARRLLAAYPSYATTASLREIARDRHVLTFPEQMRAAQEEAAKDWIEANKDAGLPFGVMRQAQYLFAPEVPKVRLVQGNSERAVWYTLDSDGTFSAVRQEVSNWDWDSEWALGLPEPTKIHRFFLIVYAPASVTPYTPDEAPSETMSLGASGLTKQMAINIEACVRYWKSAGSVLWGWILAFDPDSFDPEGDNTSRPGGYPDGDWFRAYIPGVGYNRDQTARYYEIRDPLV